MHCIDNTVQYIEYKYSDTVQFFLYIIYLLYSQRRRIPHRSTIEEKLEVLTSRNFKLLTSIHRVNTLIDGVRVFSSVQYAILSASVQRSSSTQCAVGVGVGAVEFSRGSVRGSCEWGARTESQSVRSGGTGETASQQRLPEAPAARPQVASASPHRCARALRN